MAKKILDLAKMNMEKVKQILNGGENATTEFKVCIDKVSNSVYETVCSFLNYKGDYIFLGVKDNGEVVGVNPASANQIVKTLINASNSRKNTKTAIDDILRKRQVLVFDQ